MPDQSPDPCTDPWQPVAAQCDAINTHDLNAHRSFYAMLRRDVPRLAGMIPPEAEAIIQWARRTFGGGCGLNQSAIDDVRNEV